MANQVIVDPWAEANNPTAPAQQYWGQVMLAARLVVLMKGAPGGKVDYSPGQVMPDGSEPRPVTSVKLALTPLAEMNQKFDVVRETLAQSHNEWGKTILPSLRDCGITDVKDVNGRWTKIELVETGRSYVNSGGETKQATTIKFLKVFADEATCRADYLAENPSKAGGNGNGNGAHAATNAGPGAAAPATNGNGGERATALKFLKIPVNNAWRKSGKDLQKALEEVAPLIAGNPLLAKYFTADSQEVLEMFNDLMQAPF